MVLALCCCCCYVHTVVTSYQFCCFVCNETFFVYCAAFRLSDCAGGAAGCHGEPENHRGGAGSVGPPLPGEDPTDCKESCHSSLLPCHFMLRACSQPQPSVVSHHTFAVALSAPPPPPQLSVLPLVPRLCAINTSMLQLITSVPAIHWGREQTLITC